MLDSLTNVVPFKPRIPEDSWSEAERHEHLAILHDYLEAALDRQRPNGSTRVTLCIDDIMLICELIESRIGPGYFSDDIA